MLSRLTTRAALATASRSASTSSAAAASAGPIVTKENPERDLVNFPRRQRPIHMPPVRMGFIPEEWFKSFHDKTGVTGPYMFMVSVGTYLLSKEILVLEHNFYAGLAGVVVLTGAYKMIRNGFVEKVDKMVEENEAKLKAVRQDEIDRCKNAIASEEKLQWMGTSYETLIQAKKDNVALQLEAAYRERLQDAFQQVKRRLDYQMEVGGVHRRVEQKHMVDWIIKSVKQSITAKQEEEALRKCVADLKGLKA